MKILTSDFTIQGTNRLHIEGFEGDVNLTNVFVNVPYLNISNVSFNNTIRISNVFVNTFSETGEFDFSKIKLGAAVNKFSSYEPLFNKCWSPERPLYISNLRIDENLNTFYLASGSDDYYTPIQVYLNNVVIPNAGSINISGTNPYVTNSKLSGFEFQNASASIGENVTLINKITLRGLSGNIPQFTAENITYFYAQGNFQTQQLSQFDFSNTKNMYIYSGSQPTVTVSLGNTAAREFYFQAGVNWINNTSFNVSNEFNGFNTQCGWIENVFQFDNITYKLNGSVHGSYSSQRNQFFNNRTHTLYNINLFMERGYAFDYFTNLQNISFTNLHANGLQCMFWRCNLLTNESVKNIINAFITFDNQITGTKNLMTNNGSGPFYQTKFDNSYYTEYHEQLTAKGWTF